MLTKQATEAYANYEQLKGGVETLFDESADLMMKYAADAYKTAGVSSNTYMETVTSFAAALTKSVQAAGGSMDEAVEIADTAMRDMADNANKMGTSMESIQAAYQGFAKQNYTMLDNLKLGYGGTKEEMERLIADANKLRKAQGLAANLTISSYADIVTAIHEVQVEMGIFNTTELEATETISGSLNMLKGAWDNLLVGFADQEQAVGPLIDRVLSSRETYLANIMPRISETLAGIAEGVTNALPAILEKIPTIAGEMLPRLTETALLLVTTLGTSLLEYTPILIENAMSMMSNLLLNFANKMPEFYEWAKRLVINIGSTLLKNRPSLIGSALSLLGALLGGISQALLDVGGAIVTGIWNGISNAKAWFESQVKGFFSGIVNGVKGVLGIHSPSKVFAEIGRYMAEGLGEGWSDEYSKIRKDITNGLDFSGTTANLNLAGGNANGAGSVSVVQNIYSQAKTAADLMEERLYNQKKAVMMNV